jgi:hypothetical protein
VSDAPGAVNGGVDDALGPDRRTFVRRLVVGGVFAAPIVSSFSMSGIQAVFGSTPRSTALAGNANTTPQYPVNVRCFTLNGNLLNTTFPDTGGVTLHLVVPGPPTTPTPALPTGTSLCVSRGNLTALASAVPPGEVPVSAYAVKWDATTGSPHQDASSPLTLGVTTSAVQAGDPIYTIDSGSPVSAGPPAGAGSWTVNFTHDPDFVVTHVVPSEPGTPSSGGGAATPIEATPRTTG